MRKIAASKGGNGVGYWNGCILEANETCFFTLSRGAWCVFQWIWDDLQLKQVTTLSLSLACPLITIISYAGSSVIGRPCHIVTLFVVVGKQHKEQSDAHGIILESVIYCDENGWRNSTNLWCPSALSSDKSCHLWGSSNPIRTGGSTLNEGSRWCVVKPWLLTVQKSPSNCNSCSLFVNISAYLLLLSKEFGNHPLQGKHFLYPSKNLETWFFWYKTTLTKSSENHPWTWTFWGVLIQ